MNLWDIAKALPLQVGDGITGGFDIGFDPKIQEDTKTELRRFVAWAEENYRFPVTLWVDFEFRHYLVSRGGKRVGYLFYWADFDAYPAFDNPDDIPVIRLPVRTEHWTMEEILTSFIEAISCYFAWLADPQGIAEFSPNEEEVEKILQTYLRQC